MNFDYTKFTPLDIFVSHRRNITGGIIRASCTGRFKRAFDRTLPNHAGFLIDLYGQYFAAEMGPDGLVLNSLEKYRTKKEMILEIYRWNQFLWSDNSATLTGCRKVAEQARKKIEYDWGGAIISSRFGRRIFRRMKNKKEKLFCSEHVCEILDYCGAEKFSPALNPMDLQKVMKHSHDFSLVEGWKI